MASLQVPYPAIKVSGIQKSTRHLRGNPLEIKIKLHFTRTLSSQVSESQYPPLHLWSHPDVNMAPEMHLQCDDGHAISSIAFASYGTPQGICQGRNSCYVEVSNKVFGSDA